MQSFITRPGMNAPEVNHALRRVILFGLDKLSSVAWHDLSHDTPFDVVAFTVNAAYLRSERLHELPVVAFETLVSAYPPSEHAIHIPIGWKRMNALRAEKLAEARGMGYPVLTYVSSHAAVSPDCRIGANCGIHPTCAIGAFARIGDNCTISGMSLISHHCVVGDHCYVAGGAMIHGGAQIGDHCVIGANAVVLNGVKVAPRCFIAAGAMVTRDTVEGGVYDGRPARRRKVPVERLPTVR